MAKNHISRPEEHPAVKEILFRSRTITLFEEIDRESASDIIRQMIAMDQVSKKSASFTLMINSPGGELSAMMAIIDKMGRVRSKIDTVIVGEVCSAATLIALHGNNRMMTENAAWMGHEMSQFLVDYHSKLVK